MTFRSLIRRNSIGCLAAGVVAAACVFTTATPTLAAAADDKPKARITLTDGRVLEGTIEREIDGYIYLNLGIGTRLLAPSDYQFVEREGGEAGDAPVDISKKTYRDALPAKERGVLFGAVVSMEGPVGSHMTETPIADAVAELEADGIDVVVLKFNSGGGALIEIEKMSNVIEDEYKPRFHTVAWIESAISAAAMTSYTLSDIYFMPKGNFGSATGWRQSSGGIELVEGRSLERALYLMERIAERSGHSPDLFRAMQILDQPISYDRNERTGEVTIRTDLDGEFILNRGDDILSINATEAEHVGLSKGTAGTLEELEKHILANYPDRSIEDIVWIGEEDPTGLYPVSTAEEIQRDWRQEADYIDGEFKDLTWKYAMARENATADPLFVTQAERLLSQIERVAKRHVNLAIFNGFTEQFFEQERRYLNDLRRGR